MTSQARRAEIAELVGKIGDLAGEWVLAADRPQRDMKIVDAKRVAFYKTLEAELSRLTAQVEGMSAPEGYVLVPVTDLTNVAAGIERHTQRESVSKVASDRMGEWSQQLRALAARPGVGQKETEK